MLKRLVLLVVSAALLAACFGPPYVSGGVGIEVGGPPPGLRADVTIAAPGPEFVWIPGFWDWSPASADWVWVPGVWQRRPHARAVWVAPRYERHRGHWRYRRGHWR
jgi:hypothetical protein